MNNSGNFSRWVMLIAVSLGLALPIFAANSSNGLPIYIWAAGDSTASDGSFRLSGYFEDANPAFGQTLHESDAVTGSGELKVAFDESPRLLAERRYDLSVMASEISSYYVQVVAPPGYRVRLDGKIRNRITNTDCAGIIPIVIERVRKMHPDLAGVANDTAVVGMDWQLPLGNRMAGGPSGNIVIVDAGLETETDWSRFWKPSCLDCEPTTDEVAVYRVDGVIRRVIANQVAVAIDTVNATSFTVKCYNTKQLDGADNQGLPKFIGLPYVAYTFGPGSSNTSLQIQRVFRDIASASDTSAPISHQDSMSYERTGALPTFSWTKRDWSLADVDGVPLLVTDSAVEQPSGYRKETIAVKPKNGAVVFQLVRRYGAGEWLISEELNNGTSIKNDFSYYVDAASQGSFGHLKYLKMANGSRKYLQYNTVPWASDSGQVSKTIKTYLNNQISDTDPTASENVSEVTSYTYTNDANGAKTLLSEVITKIENKQTAWSKYSYVFTGGVTTVTRTDYADATTTLVTTKKVNRDDSPDPFTRSTPIEIVTPDGVKKQYTYEKGWWDGSSFSVASGGTASREIEKITSVRIPSDATGFRHETTIRDERGLVVAKESRASESGAWFARTLYFYNFLGQLVRTESSNGAIQTCTYTGPYKVSETDAMGITTAYAYDAYGRLASSTRSGGGSGTETISAVATTYEYDAAGHKLFERVGSGTEKLVTSRTYDSAGFLTSEATPGVGATTFTYEIANNRTTMTLPDGATKVEEKYPDGRHLSTTGTSVVGQFSSYVVATDGKQLTTVKTGSNSISEPRWRKTTVDWLGRMVASEGPGAPGNSSSIEQNTYETGTGLLVATTKTGYATSRFAYDGYGRAIRSGLDLTVDGTLTVASQDRISESYEGVYDSFEGAYWLKSEKRTYPTSGSGTALTTSVSRKRLSGFESGCLEETVDTDVAGNVTRTKLFVDRASGIATRRTTKTGIESSQIEKLVAGKTVSLIGFDGLKVSTEYDALLRPYKTIDTRGNATTADFYTGTTLQRRVYDGVCTVASGKFVKHAAYDVMGRPVLQQDALGNATYTAYNTRGQVLRQWGGGTYPTESLYNTYGERVEMRTWRANPPTWANGSDLIFNPSPTALASCDSRTYWSFDPATGLLLSKTDAEGRTASQSYNSRGQTATRTLARTLNGQPVTTTYSYDPATGELLSQTYSDGTPTVTYTYNRAGQMATVSDVTGTRTLGYNAWMQPTTETLASSFYGGRTLTRLYETAGMPGRIRGLQLTAGSVIEQSNDYQYQSSGRFAKLAETHQDGGAARTFVYGYLGDAALINSLTIEGNTAFGLKREYEPYRNLVTSIATTWGSSSTITDYDFTYDDRGYRATSTQSGAAFAEYKNSSGTATPISQSFVYNGRGELVQATSYLSNAAGNSADVMPGRDFVFEYDAIGNRTATGRTGVNGLKETYVTDRTNAYSSRTNHTVQVAGTVDPAAKVEVKDATAASGRKGSFWSEEVTVANNAGPYRGGVSVFAGKSGTPDLLSTRGCVVQVAAEAEVLGHDADGNLTSDGLWKYFWDAENRLYRMEAGDAAVGASFPNRALEFRYDYLGRRVLKRLLNRVGSNWILESEMRFIYDGWNLLAEYSVNGSTLILSRSYVWGLDIVHSLTQAGGVGALVQINEHTSRNSYLAAYDANGNVTALVNANNGNIAAIYEYSPYGEFLRAIEKDPSIGKQPFRFSTKYTDLETGLVYYGTRYYDPRNGRFINRDTIEESGGINLYGFVLNNPVNAWDMLGMAYGSAPDKDWVLIAEDNAAAVPWVTWGRINPETGIKEFQTDYQDNSDMLNYFAELEHSQSLFMEELEQRYSEWTATLNSIWEEQNARLSGEDEIVIINGKRCRATVEVGVVKFIEYTDNTSWRDPKPMPGESMLEYGFRMALDFYGSPEGADSFSRTMNFGAFKLGSSGIKIAEKAGGIIAQNGTTITGITKHGIDRVLGDGAKRAGVKPEALLDALKNPTKIVSGIDDKGRPFQVFTGQNARVVVNPATGQIVSTNPLSRAGAQPGP